jgi:hypothetical protein
LQLPVSDLHSIRKCFGKAEIRRDWDSQCNTASHPAAYKFIPILPCRSKPTGRFGMKLGIESSETNANMKWGKGWTHPKPWNIGTSGDSFITSCSADFSEQQILDDGQEDLYT